MSSAIAVENLSKAYQIGEFTTGTLGQDLSRWWALARGKEDPFLKVGETNDRASKGESNVVWSLRDLEFEIEQGKATGIIGKNGAGKSTLLKVLSQITTPTRGNVKMRGRVASLLEVGTGFHPELTGRENIFLNGAILGMRKKEIKRKLDEIVDFAGVERYLETPVKRYSSGMYVRLAFAVAAHLESEILIVDEVLAVGDAEFQKKCLGKMGDINKSEGRTILFVSHIMSSISAFCENSLLLTDGQLTMFDKTETVIRNYLDGDLKDQTYYRNMANEENKTVYLEEARTKTINKEDKNTFEADESFLIDLKVRKTIPVRGVYGHLTIQSSDGIIVIETDTLEQKSNIYDTSEVGLIEAQVEIPKRILKTGKYYVSLGLASYQADVFQLESLPNFLSFEVVAQTTERDTTRQSVLSLIPKWE